MMENYPGIPDEGWMEGLEGGTFISFGSGPVVVEFLENTPRKRSNSWGKDVWDWDVLLLNMEDHFPIGERKLSTASRRLRRCLMAHHPLKGKRLRISRSGDKMETEYSVTEATKPQRDLV